MCQICARSSTRSRRMLRLMAAVAGSELRFDVRPSVVPVPPLESISPSLFRFLSDPERQAAFCNAVLLPPPGRPHYMKNRRRRSRRR